MYTIYLDNISTCRCNILRLLTQLLMNHFQYFFSLFYEKSHATLSAGAFQKIMIRSQCFSCWIENTEEYPQKWKRHLSGFFLGLPRTEREQRKKMKKEEIIWKNDFTLHRHTELEFKKGYEKKVSSCMLKSFFYFVHESNAFVMLRFSRWIGWKKISAADERQQILFVFVMFK